MRILLDTNILIYRESNQILSEDIQELTKILNRGDFDILIHPATFDDISKDGYEKRKRIMESKFKTYSTLEKPPNPLEDQEFLDRVEWYSHPEDEIDNKILYAVCRNAVDFLITEDHGIHHNAKEIGIDERVLLAQDALKLFEQKEEKPPNVPPSLEKNYVYNLDISDPIFDSLKRDYPDFEDWFEKISKEGRKCYVNRRKDGKVGALLIYKLEEEDMTNTSPPLPLKRRLKICTLKVTHVGYKIGELFIKTSVDMALKKGCEQIYLTHFTEPDDRLVSLINDFGFYKGAVKHWDDGREEDIFLKELFAGDDVEQLSPLEISEKYYPTYYHGRNVRKFIVPIVPKYHDRLFTDCGGRQTFLHEHAGEFVTEGNTIKKAYLSHSKTGMVRPGDILLFYRSHDQQRITSLGVVEKVHDELTNAGEIASIVGKRTVYSLREIEEMSEKETKVILFRHHFHLPLPLDYKFLRKQSIIKGPTRSITKIDHDNYLKMVEKGGIDERFTVD